ncbi:endonuclease V [Clostridium zeae]|uniref:Endonuclease V n=1 Tax=Clostridium zeae TaxID=2759022 RepID=A0ABQ1EBX8_9CLOT|nr:endonuclease V [Clostridium zeae]GFZ32145.1 endonuclease V [Clostridium zeae]
MFRNIKDEAEAINIQNKLNKLIVINNNFDFKGLKRVAGVDLAYWKVSDIEYAVCCIVVIDSSTEEVLEKVYTVSSVSFPYIPGCLAFRELPLVIETVSKLKAEPDLYIFDGNGYLHPRHMGIATHASIYLNKPTLGVAKSYYKIQDVDFTMPENHKGAYTDIIINNDIYGRAIRTHKDVKPIFLSVGNYIDLETATEIVNRLVSTESHIPIPTRLADIETHRIRTMYKNVGTSSANNQG